MIQKPETSSFGSAKGGATTFGSPPANTIRAPLEVGCKPSPASMMPAFIISSLNLPIAATSSALGILPASLSRVALTCTMKRIPIPLRSDPTVDSRAKS